MYIFGAYLFVFVHNVLRHPSALICGVQRCLCFQSMQYFTVQPVQIMFRYDAFHRTVRTPCSQCALHVRAFWPTAPRVVFPRGKFHVAWSSQGRRSAAVINQVDSSACADASDRLHGGLIFQIMEFRSRTVILPTSIDIVRSTVCIVHLGFLCCYVQRQ